MKKGRGEVILSDLLLSLVATDPPVAEFVVSGYSNCQNNVPSGTSSIVCLLCSLLLSFNNFG